MPEEAEQSTTDETAADGGKSSGLDKVKNFFTMGGDKDKWTKTIIVSVVVVVIMGLGSTAIWGVALAFWVRSIGEPNGNSNQVIGACYLKDDAFRDTTSLTNADDVMNKLKPYTPLPDKAKTQMIIDESKKNGLNPAVLIAFWNGEQTFGNDEKAFGCGNYHPGGSDYGFEKQLKCAIPPIKDAMSLPAGTGSYVEPKGENIWTRLLYNYVAAGRKALYDSKGYVSDGSEPRIVILKKLVPDQVTCAPGGGALTAMDFRSVGPGNRSQQYGQWKDIVDVMHAVGTPGASGKGIVPYTFMGKRISGGVNQAIAPALDKVQADLKASGVNYKIISIGGFNWRANANAGGKISPHAFGVAVDINPFGQGNDNCNPRKAGFQHRDSSPEACHHTIPKAFSDAWEKNGFFWGAKFYNISDTMHFQYGGNYDTSRIDWNGGNIIVH